MNANESKIDFVGIDAGNGAKRRTRRLKFNPWISVRRGSLSAYGEYTECAMQLNELIVLRIVFSLLIYLQLQQHVGPQPPRVPAYAVSGPL